MRYEAALFDLDGVIIDSNAGITDCWNRLAAEHRMELTPSDFEKYIYGCPARETLDLLFGKLTSADREVALRKLTDYESNLQYREIPGAVQFLKSLRKWGIPVALVTSSAAWKVKIIEQQLGIGALFTELITSERIRHGKPDPECYRLAAECLAKLPEKCIVFEDAVSGVTAAVKAGAFCIGVQQGSMVPPLIAAGAGMVVPDFAQVHFSGSGLVGSECEFEVHLGQRGMAIELYDQPAIAKGSFQSEANL